MDSARLCECWHHLNSLVLPDTPVHNFLISQRTAAIWHFGKICLSHSFFLSEPQLRAHLKPVSAGLGFKRGPRNQQEWPSKPPVLLLFPDSTWQQISANRHCGSLIPHWSASRSRISQTGSKIRCYGDRSATGPKIFNDQSKRKTVMDPSIGNNKAILFFFF